VRCLCLDRLPWRVVLHRACMLISVPPVPRQVRRLTKPKPR